MTEKQTPPKTEAKVQGRDAGKKVDLGLFYICNIKFNFGLPTEK